MATAKRKQEELGDECDEQESHEADPCSDDDDAKRPRLDLHLHMPHHRQWSDPSADLARPDQARPDLARPDHVRPDQTRAPNHAPQRDDNASAKYASDRYDNFYYNYDYSRMCKDSNDSPFDLSNWHVKVNTRYDEVRETKTSESVDSDENLNVNDNADDSSQPINFAYYHF